MTVLQIVRDMATSKRSALLQPPVGEFLVLGMLLVGLQSGLNSSGLSSAGVAKEGMRDDKAALIVNAPTPVPSSRLNAIVDRLNDSNWSGHSNLNSMHLSSTEVELPPRLRLPANALHTDQNEYAFTSQLEIAENKANWQKRFPQSEFHARTGDDRLAIWRINQRFTLANASNSANLSIPKQKKPGEQFVIMLDPGHGGSDPGSVGHNGLQEKTLTLAIAKQVQSILAKDPSLSVQLTRNADFGLSRKNRVEKVIRSRADMVVSLHLNHLPQSDVNLVEAFYAAPHNIRESIEKQREEQKLALINTRTAALPDFRFTQSSRKLANLVQRHVYNEVRSHDPETDNAGVKEDTLYILTRSFTPGALIELSCLSNIREAERLGDPAYIKELAEALAAGIREYVNTPEAKHQYGPGV